jgi:hypothetical protein
MAAMGSSAKLQSPLSTCTTSTIHGPVFLRRGTEQSDFLDSPGRSAGDHKSNLSGNKVDLLEVNDAERRAFPQ